MGRLSDFVKGYIVVEIKGLCREKFLNLAATRRIKLKDIKYYGEDKTEVKIGVKDFFRLRGIGKISGCKIKAASRKGAVFKIKKYRKRTALFAGIFLFFIIVKSLSLFVLDIKITGCEETNPSAIMNQLEECGLKRGTFNYKLKGSKIAQRLMAKNKSLAWVGITVRGSCVDVEVVEKKLSPDMYKDGEFYNIVASADGIVEEFFLKKGFPVVKKGDVVKKGQLLVSGVSDSRFKTAVFKNPDADIKITSWISVSKEIKTEKTVENLTGKKVVNRGIIIDGQKYVTKFEVPYKYYNVKTTEKKFFNKIGFVKYENFENIPLKKKYNEKELIENEKKVLYNNIKEKMGENFTCSISDFSYEKQGISIFMKMTVKVSGPSYEKIPLEK